MPSRASLECAGSGVRTVAAPRQALVHTWRLSVRNPADRASCVSTPTESLTVLPIEIRQIDEGDDIRASPPPEALLVVASIASAIGGRRRRPADGSASCGLWSACHSSLCWRTPRLKESATLPQQAHPQASLPGGLSQLGDGERVGDTNLRPDVAAHPCAGRRVAETEGARSLPSGSCLILLGSYSRNIATCSRTWKCSRACA